jgi:hypothetical protein
VKNYPFHRALFYYTDPERFVKERIEPNGDPERCELKLLAGGTDIL